MQEEVQKLPTTNEAGDASDEDTPSGDGDLPEGWEEAAAENVGCDDSTAPRGRDPKARRIDTKEYRDHWVRRDADGKRLRPKPGHHSGHIFRIADRDPDQRAICREKSWMGCVKKLGLRSSPTFRAENAVPS